MRREGGKPEPLLQIVNERIAILLKLAEENAKVHPERSKRYVELARRLATRYRVRLGKLKWKFCKKCGAFWVPGYNVKVRMVPREKRIIYRCAECGWERSIIYAKRKVKTKAPQSPRRGP